MRIKLQRHASISDCTIGELSIDGRFECYTLEDTVREIRGVPVSVWKIPGQTAIPVGHYPVEITQSQRFKKPLPLLLNVPGFIGIRIHAGNTAANTEGCILVGKEVAPDNRSIRRSADAFKDLYIEIQEALDAGDAVTIDVKNP